MNTKVLKKYWQYLDLHQKRAHQWAIIGCIGLLLIAAVVARISLLKFVNPDYDVFSSWYDYVNAHGLHSFKEAFSNYNPPYTYFLYISTLLPISKLIAIKAMMALFDIVLAVGVYYLVKALRPTNYTPWIAVIVTLFLPVTLITGAFWGQFDQFYAGFILLSLAAGIKNNSRWAWIFFGIAISIKFQAIFFLPVLGVLSFKRIRWYDAYWAALAFALLTMPPVLAGRSIGSLLDIYPAQARLFQGQLVLNVPNMYQWVSNSAFDYLNGMGIMLGLAVALLILLTSIMYKKFSPAELLLTTTLALLAIPFFLPAMHERYLVPGVMAVSVLPFVYPRLAWTAVVMQVTTLLSYCPFLFRTAPIPLGVLAVANLAVIFGLTTEYLKPHLKLTARR